MKNFTKTFILQIIVFFSLFISCEKDRDINVYKNIDKNLIGKWETHYSTVDINYGIIVYTEILEFNYNNSGKRDVYKFKELDISSSFYWYIDSTNLLCIKIDGKNLQWNYIVRNDSLFISENQIFIRNNK
jgi:hypothetical protein